MALSEKINESAFIVRRVKCGCMIAIAIVSPGAAAELFEHYEHDPEFEIDLVDCEQARLAWRHCEHHTGADFVH